MIGARVHLWSRGYCKITCLGDLNFLSVARIDSQTSNQEYQINKHHWIDLEHEQF